MIGLFVIWLAIALYIKWLLNRPGIHYEWRGFWGWAIALGWPIAGLLLVFKFVSNTIRQ